MDEEFGRRVLEQAFELWFRPELDRRAASGAVPPGFVMWGGQVVLNLDRDHPEVRINNEIRGVFQAKATRQIAVGEAVGLGDFDDILGMQLTNEDANAGHLTAFLHKSHWFLFFDFRYNATRIEEQLASADQFLAAAEFSVSRQHGVSAVDNLYDAVQIMAKSFLLMYPDHRVLESRTHGFIETRFNLEGKLKNVPAYSVRLMNRLKELRPKTRYATEPARVPEAELNQLVADAKEMRAELEARRPRRYALGERSGS